MKKKEEIINYPLIEIPSEVLCSTCVGWGTIIKRIKRLDEEEVVIGKPIYTNNKCIGCCGTGRRKVPEGEVI
jgi:hypothetical protein